MANACSDSGFLKKLALTQTPAKSKCAQLRLLIISQWFTGLLRMLSGRNWPGRLGIDPLLQIFFLYRSICIIDNGASRRRPQNARFRARRADHSTTSMCLLCKRAITRCRLAPLA